MGGKTRKIGQSTDVVKARYSSPSEMYITGWDKNCGSAQASIRAEERTAMGQKKTPIGRGVAIRHK